MQAQFGKYRIVRKLATGGMADIYLAVIDGPDGFSKTCVVKRILSEYASMDVFSRMFAGEAKVAALLNHPNIVQVFDFGKIDGQYFIAMEWVQGASLDRVVRRAARASFRLGPRMAVNVGVALAEALSYAHSRTLPDGTPLRLVHRDITPGNVLLSRDGMVKLADFGIVKSSVNPEQTAVGVVKGKYPYMSPEQVLNKELDARSDLFSLGIVLYELSTSKYVFKRETLEQTIVAISRAEVPPPSSQVKDYPPALEGIVLKLLALAPEDRYQTAAELHAALEQFRTSQSWTGGGRDISMMMAELFPPGTEDELPAEPISSASLEPSPPVNRPIDVATAEEGGFPWLLAAAAGAAILGTIVFWAAFA